MVSAGGRARFGLACSRASRSPAASGSVAVVANVLTVLRWERQRCVLGSGKQFLSALLSLRLWVGWATVASGAGGPLERSDTGTGRCMGISAGGSHPVWGGVALASRFSVTTRVEGDGCSSMPCVLLSYGPLGVGGLSVWAEVCLGGHLHHSPVQPVRWPAPSCRNTRRRYQIVHHPRSKSVCSPLSVGVSPTCSRNVWAHHRHVLVAAAPACCWSSGLRYASGIGQSHRSYLPPMAHQMLGYRGSGVIADPSPTPPDATSRWKAFSGGLSGARTHGLYRRVGPFL